MRIFGLTLLVCASLFVVRGQFPLGVIFMLLAWFLLYYLPQLHNHQNNDDE